MKPAQPNESLIDGIACLQRLAANPDPVRGADMARELGLDVTRANRLLKTLAWLGLADQDSARRYRPGPAIHVLAAQAAFGSGLLRASLPALEELGSYKLEVAMGVLWRGRVSYLYYAEPGMHAVEALGRSGILPATQSGIGLSLLARLPDQELSTHVTPTPGLYKILKSIRTHGYALTPVDKTGNRALSVGVGHPAVAAIAFKGIFRDESIPRLHRALLAAAAEIESKLNKASRERAAATNT